MRLLLFSILGVTLTTALLSLTAYMYYQREIQKPILLQKDPLSINIKRGMGVGEISLYLKENRLIQNQYVFKIYLFLSGKNTIQAGYYRLSKDENLNLVKLVDKLQDGSFERRLTFIEGWRVEEYANYLAKEIDPEFSKEFLTSNFTKEGYMFPDTYIADDSLDPSNLASWMRNNFNKRVDSSLVDKATARGVPMDFVVTLASILERESNKKSDRPIIAGILIKRINNNWPLQTDATLQYALGTKADWWPTVKREDYQGLNSAYNTYTNRGLPPNPICNPSLDAISAVINYDETTSYWFYMTGKDGITRYAITLEEHNANVAKYL